MVNHESTGGHAEVGGEMDEMKWQVHTPSDREVICRFAEYS